MTDQHKAALAQGRNEGRAVRGYMQALQSTNAPKRRGRKGKSAEELQQAIMEATDPMERLALRPQLRAALEAESGETVDMEVLTAEFVKVLASYSERTGLTYADWREEGVPPAVLKSAGLKRGL